MPRNMIYLSNILIICQFNFFKSFYFLNSDKNLNCFKHFNHNNNNNAINKPTIFVKPTDLNELKLQIAYFNKKRLELETAL